MGEARCPGHLCLPVRRTLKKEKAPPHLDMKIVWKTWPVWLVNFTERTGSNLKLAIFTIINLIANVSYAKGPCCAVAISHEPHFLCLNFLLLTLVLIKAAIGVQTLCYLAQAQ